MGIPAKAAPIANESQYLAATKVDPRAPVITGTRHFTGWVQPNWVVMSTFGNTHLSGLLSPPFQPNA